jgi:hypothetical protein
LECHFFFYFLHFVYKTELILVEFSIKFLYPKEPLIFGTAVCLKKKTRSKSNKKKKIEIETVRKPPRPLYQCLTAWQLDRRAVAAAAGADKPPVKP